MEVKGILKGCVNSQSGTSQATGNQWRTDEWLVVIPGPYEKKMVMRVRGNERCEQWKQFFDGMPDKNQPVLIKFDIDAREHEGKWFNSVDAWDICLTQW